MTHRIERNEPGTADSGGRVVIEFADDDEMHRILNRIAGSSSTTTLACIDCGYDNIRPLPLDLTILDWCRRCGRVFGDVLPRYILKRSARTLSNEELLVWLRVVSDAADAMVDDISAQAQDEMDELGSWTPDQAFKVQIPYHRLDTLRTSVCRAQGILRMADTLLSPKPPPETEPEQVLKIPTADHPIHGLTPEDAMRSLVGPSHLGAVLPTATETLAIIEGAKAAERMTREIVSLLQTARDYISDVAEGQSIHPFATGGGICEMAKADRTKLDALLSRLGFPPPAAEEAPRDGE